MLFVLALKKEYEGLRLNKYIEIEKVMNISFVRKEILV